jgi:ubiquinone/menaquinone biosynthesis C-methylase UbiE
VTERRERETRRVQRRYDLYAPLYDLLTSSGQLAGWRRTLWSRATGPRILEVGVGTGQNFPCYPPDAEVTGIELSPKMLARARKKAAGLGIAVDLRQMDVQHLDYADNSFDTVVATLVFCAVPDSALGLREIARVCRTGGRVLLLEHVISDNRLLAGVMNLLNPLTRFLGDNINRRTVDEVAESPLRVDRVTDLSPRVFKMIEATSQ